MKSHVIHNVLLLFIFYRGGCGTHKAHAECAKTFWRHLHQALPIVFSDIPATQYQLRSKHITAKVRQSSSFLLIPLTTQCTLSSFSWYWKQLSGHLNTDWAGEHTTKAQDDALFRLGCLLPSTSSPPIPWFAPRWLKKISHHLKIPSQQMLYLTLAPKPPNPAQWVSPYSSSIQSQAFQLGPDGEMRYIQTKKIKCSGFFFGADGDNTRSTFTVEITPYPTKQIRRPRAGDEK
ncbi:MAG: hypothetical protein OXT67_12635 [Zetaproteobacteria bacterium]|nr:hypothetical protein [Zetaproteobacteria bacterium]